MNEVRLIDANALKEELKQYFTNGVALYQILTIIDNAPTEEQMRCGNCIHNGEKSVTGNCIKCKDFDRYER